MEFSPCLLLPWWCDILRHVMFTDQQQRHVADTQGRSAFDQLQEFTLQSVCQKGSRCGKGASELGPPARPPSFVTAGLLSLKWPWISMNPLIHKHCQKRCKGSTEPRGSKRGLVLNLCLLNLEMTSSVRYNLILAEQIQSGWPAPTCRRLSTMTGDWERGGQSLCGALWETDTDMCGNISPWIGFSQKRKQILPATYYKGSVYSTL